MANNENLIPFSERTENEQRKICSMGGKASGKKRRELKTIKEYLEKGLKIKVTDKKGNQVTAKEAGVLKLIQRYMQGDYRAFDTVAELLGENPATKVEITNLTPQIVVANQADAEIIKQIQNVKTDENIL